MTAANALTLKAESTLKAAMQKEISKTVEDPKFQGSPAQELRTFTAL
jgi:hypothetical protein